MTLEEKIREILTDLMYEYMDTDTYMNNVESAMAGLMKEYIDHIQTLTDIIDQEMVPHVWLMHNVDIGRLNTALIKSRKLLS